MMKFPSFHGISGAMLQVTRRFPLALASSVIGAIISIVLIKMQVELDGWWGNVLLTLSLAVPAFIGIVLFTEAKMLVKKLTWGLQSIAILLLILYGFLLPVGIDSLRPGNLLLHVLLGIAFALLCTFIPFVFQDAKNGIQRFWEFNKKVFFAGAVTMIWAVALQTGLMVAYFAINFLFELNLEQDWIAYIQILISGVFAPFFFLSRVPENPHMLQAETSYPKEVRLFSQYLLVPLVTLYFLILYVYTIRILVTLEWPQGELAWMIIGFSFVGVLTYLAMYPLRATHRWARYFGAGLFMAMIPQTGMLFWALSFRLRDYGITENRYFVLVFGGWLLVCAIYYLVSRMKDIRLIPISLCVLAILASFGPWGASAVSERSQVNRLEEILVQNELLKDGQYVASTQNISQNDEQEILEILRYLSEYHSFNAIESWFGGEDLDSLDGSYWSRADRLVTEKFGLDVNGARDDIEFFHIRLPPNEQALPIDGYNWAIHLSQMDSMETFTLEGSTYSLYVPLKDPFALELRRAGEVLVSVNLTSIVELAKKQSEGKPEEMFVLVENERVNLRLLVRSLRGSTRSGETEIEELNGLLLLTLK